MTSIDPLAGERFRTILGDIAYDYAREMNIYELVGIDFAERIVSEFPQAHFEYRVNEAGVRVRKVVVESREEIDPNAVPAGDSLGERPHSGEHCHNGGRPHLGPCVDPLAFA